MKTIINLKKLSGALVLLMLLFSYSCNRNDSDIPEDAAAVLFVSPEGNDANPGTYQEPFQSIERARDEVRAVKSGVVGKIYVFLRDGLYPVMETIVFTAEDSGNEGQTIIYSAYSNEKPILSGGIMVSGWEKVNAQIYKTYLDRDAKLRALYVNGKRARMAEKESKIKGQTWGQYLIDGNETWAVESGEEIAGISFNKDELKVLSNPRNVELIQERVWNEKILCLADMFSQGENTIAEFQQPFGAFATTMRWATLDPEKPFAIRNAREFLDQPGEFYFDTSIDTLYYFADGEDMSNAEVIVPTCVNLMKLSGNSTGERLKNIEFRGITFAHDDWLMQSIDDANGFVGIQSLGLTRYYIEDGNWHPGQYESCEVPAGTIELSNCENIRFERNRFEHLGNAIALNLVNDVVNAEITGNYFNDMLGNAVNVGHPHHYIIGDGPLYPEGVEGVCKDILISNNYVRNACIDFRQVEGITGFFVENVSILHNDVNGTPYGGIALGWWWGNSEIPPSRVAKNNQISFNKVGNTHMALRDGGIIYVLGKQENSVISQNYLYDGPRQVYPDDGSAFWVIRENVFENVVDQEFQWLFLHTPRCHDLTFDNNYIMKDTVRNEGTNITVTNTHIEPNAPPWSAEAQGIIDQSGLEETFKDIVDH